MVDVERTVRVRLPPARVHDYLRDFGNAESWDPGTQSCERIDDGPIRVGSTWRNVSIFRGKRTTLTYELTRDEPDHLIFVGRNKTATSTDDLAYVAADEETVITYRANITFHGLAKLADPFLKREFEKLADEVVRTLPGALGDPEV